MKRQAIAAIAACSLACVAPAQLKEMTSTPGASRITAAAYWRISAEKDSLFNDGEFPSAIQIISWEIIWRPNDYEAVTDLGWMYGNIERPDLELATYIRFKQQFPENPEAYYPEAQFYFLKRSYKNVVAILEPTLEFETKPHANSYRILAHSYERLGFYEKALETWDKYLLLDPTDDAAKANRDKVKAKLSGGGS